MAWFPAERCALSAHKLGRSVGNLWTLSVRRNTAHGKLAERARVCAQDLGYNPKVPLAEGVQRFCKWFKNYYDIRDGQPGNIADFNYNPL